MSDFKEIPTRNLRIKADMSQKIRNEETQVRTLTTHENNMRQKLAHALSEPKRVTQDEIKIKLLNTFMKQWTAAAVGAQIRAIGVSDDQITDFGHQVVASMTNIVEMWIEDAEELAPNRLIQCDAPHEDCAVTRRMPRGSKVPQPSEK